MNCNEASVQYLNLPTLIQPHQLNATELAPIADCLSQEGSTVVQHLIAAGSIIDLASVNCYQQGGNADMLRASVDSARVQTAKCTEILAAQAESTATFFPQLYRVSTIDTYLAFYRDPRSMPHGGWDIRSAQSNAYATVQKELLNPLLDSAPRQNFKHDIGDIALSLRALVVAQSLHRLQATHNEAVFGVFPSNIREKHSPNGAEEKHQSFDLKIVFPDQTYIPIKHPGRVTSQRHPRIAHVAGVNITKQAKPVRLLAQTMSKEVAGVRLSPLETQSLNNLTRVVLEAVVAVDAIGESIYAEDDPRTKFALYAKKWLAEDILPDLQA